MGIFVPVKANLIETCNEVESSSLMVTVIGDKSSKEYTAGHVLSNSLVGEMYSETEN